MAYATKLSKLRVLLHDMEKEMGLSSLSPVERDLIYVIEQLNESRGEVQTQQILSHDLMGAVSRPTVFRAIAALMQKGYIKRGENPRKGYYALADLHGA